MNIKMMGLILGLLVLFLIGMIKIGIAPMIFIIAWILLIEAIIFTVKNHYFDAFIKFMNPKTYKILVDKGNEFFQKNRKWNIIGMYGGSAILFLSSFIYYLTGKMTDDTVHKLNTGGLISICIVVFLFSVPLIFINNIILKRAQTANEYWKWSLIIGACGGIILAAVIFVTALMYVILRSS